jgi:hypothetical protein
VLAGWTLVWRTLVWRTLALRMLAWRTLVRWTAARRTLPLRTFVARSLVRRTLLRRSPWPRAFVRRSTASAFAACVTMRATRPERLGAARRSRGAGTFARFARMFASFRRSC